MCKKTALIIILAILPLFSMIAFASYNGQAANFSTTLPALYGNCELTRVPKTDPSVTYSKVALYNTSQVNHASVWVRNISGTSVSNKVTVYPDGTHYTINYKSGLTFTMNASVCFYGEQGSLSSKHVDGRAWAF